MCPYDSTTVSICVVLYQLFQMTYDANIYASVTDVSVTDVSVTDVSFK